MTCSGERVKELLRQSAQYKSLYSEAPGPPVTNSPKKKTTHEAELGLLRDSHHPCPIWRLSPTAVFNLCCRAPREPATGNT